MDKDLGSTVAGTGAGVLLLNTVKWDAITHGELLKVGVALLVMLFGYLMYRKRGESKP